LGIRKDLLLLLSFNEFLYYLFVKRYFWIN